MYDIDGNGELDLEEITYIIDMMDNLEGRVGGEVVIEEATAGAQILNSTVSLDSNNISP